MNAEDTKRLKEIKENESRDWQSYFWLIARLEAEAAEDEKAKQARERALAIAHEDFLLRVAANQRAESAEQDLALMTANAEKERLAKESAERRVQEAETENISLREAMLRMLRTAIREHTPDDVLTVMQRIYDTALYPQAEPQEAKQ